MTWNQFGSAIAMQPEKKDRMEYYQHKWNLVRELCDSRLKATPFDRLIEPLLKVLMVTKR